MTPSHPQAQGSEQLLSPPIADNMPQPVYRAFTAFSGQTQTETAQFDSLKEGNLTKNWYVFCSK
jgi:hypothetical protein